MTRKQLIEFMDENDIGEDDTVLFCLNEELETGIQNDGGIPCADDLSLEPESISDRSGKHPGGPEDVWIALKRV